MRPLVPDDLEAIHRLWTEPEVREYLWDGEVISRERAASVLAGNVECFERHGFGIWAVLGGENQEMVGFCGLRFLGGTSEIELLYGVAPSYWGIGLAPEASRAVIRYAFEETGLQRVLGITDPENRASRRVLEKIGMAFEGNAVREGREEVRYSVTREEFRPDDEPHAVRRT